MPSYEWLCISRDHLPAQFAPPISSWGTVLSTVLAKIPQYIGKSLRTCAPEKNRLECVLSPVSSILLSYSSILTPCFPQKCFSVQPTAISAFVLIECIMNSLHP